MQWVDQQCFTCLYMQLSYLGFQLIQHRLETPGKLKSNVIVHVYSLLSLSTKIKEKPNKTFLLVGWVPCSIQLFLLESGV